MIWNWNRHGLVDRFWHNKPTFTKVPAESEGGILLILDLNQSIQHHGPTLIKINRVRGHVWLVLLVWIPAVNLEGSASSAALTSNSSNAIQTKQTHLILAALADPTFKLGFVDEDNSLATWTTNATSRS
jgi:hypothetical protein